MRSHKKTVPGSGADQVCAEDGVNKKDPVPEASVEEEGAQGRGLLAFVLSASTLSLLLLSPLPDSRQEHFLVFSRTICDQFVG